MLSIANCNLLRHYNKANFNREKAEAEADESDRLLLEAREDARKWREAADRGWSAVQRMGHRAMRRMMNAAMWKAFGHWKRLAQSAGSFKQFRRAAERRIEELESRLHPLVAEVSALRLFKDAMASSERTMLMRKGGGFVALEEYVATVENRISAAALQEALEGKVGPCRLTPGTPWFSHLTPLLISGTFSSWN